MESEHFYLKLLPHIRGQASERAKVADILGRIAPASIDRAAYQLLNLEFIKDKLPDVHALVKAVLVDELRANIFSHIKNNTSMTCLAAMGSHWAPELGMIPSIQRLVEDVMKANSESPVYQVFFRAVDYRWDEMVRVGAGLGKFGTNLSMDISTGEITKNSAKVWVSGPDSGAFGGLMLPGFLRGTMSVLGVKGSVEITEEEPNFIEISVRW